MPRKKKNRPDVFLILDFGGSLTKGLFMGRDQNPKLLCFEPEVIGLPKSSLISYESRKMGLSTADPADRAWVGAGEQYYAVGYLARSFKGNAGLSQLKYERAFPKILAAVWAASMELGLKDSFTAAIGILLPPGEYENASRLKNLIEVGLEKFETPTGTLSVKLTHFDCKPEGGGVYMAHANRRGLASLKHKTVAVLMVGHRNASVLVAQRGQVNLRVTCDLGFVQLVKAVDEKTSGLDFNRLAEVIANAGNPPDCKVLWKVLMSSTESGRKDELNKLKNAIVASRTEYALSLKSWLREVLPKNVDEVVLCGGTSDYLRPELSEYFSCSSIFWHGVELPEQLRTQQLGNRLCDAYGMYQYFVNFVANTPPTNSDSTSSSSNRTRSTNHDTSKQQEVAAVNG
jgi:hypothetical protein